MKIIQVTIQLSEDISAALEEQWDNVPRRALEAIAVEGYRTGALTEALVRRLLELDTRFQVHAMLKEHHSAAAVHERGSRGRSRRASRAWSHSQPMIVVADSGPLHYLILLDHADLLRRLYGEVAVLPVAREAVQAITHDLDLGDRAAIALAGTLHADLLLIDEAAGPAEAKRRHLRVTRTQHEIVDEVLTVDVRACLAQYVTSVTSWC
jgi:hypothetical protein